MMNNQSKASSKDDAYCQLCSTLPATKNNKRLSSFFCDHCQLSLCYHCFEQHAKINKKDRSSAPPSQLAQIKDLFEKKRQLLSNFQEHCLRNLQSAFDEVFQDLENLRQESVSYVQQQFHDAEIILSDLMSSHLQTTSSKDSRTKEFNLPSSPLNEAIHHLEIFALPFMQLKISTLPRNKIDLYCQLFSSSYAPTKKFSYHRPGKSISTRCNCGAPNEFEIEKIDVETEIEEINHQAFINKQTQTDSDWNFDGLLPKDWLTLTNNHGDEDEDDDEYFSVQDEVNGIQQSHHRAHEYSLSKHYSSERNILTKHEVDRIATDGEHLLYFSDTSKSLCYVTKIFAVDGSADLSMTNEVVCRWPHYPILDLIYSPASTQFICATRTGVYTCIIDSDGDHATIDIQMQITHHWSYVRLAADKNHLWLWTDTPYSSQLRIYSPHTFECLQNFDLYEYPRFSDNSTSFCIHDHCLATVFQYKQISPLTSTAKKYFHVTFSDTHDLRELSTIRLGECDIDHEIRANDDGLFFVTNGKRKLWVVDATGRVEFVKLSRIGRALAMHSSKEVLIANGTKQLQRIIRR